MSQGPAPLYSGQTGSSPRAYSRHQRHRKLSSLRTVPTIHSDQFSAFLAAQATRLASTSTLIFGKLVKNTAARIKAATTFGSLS